MVGGGERWWRWLWECLDVKVPFSSTGFWWQECLSWKDDQVWLLRCYRRDACTVPGIGPVLRAVGVITAAAMVTLSTWPASTVATNRLSGLLHDGLGCEVCWQVSLSLSQPHSHLHLHQLLSVSSVFIYVTVSAPTRILMSTSVSTASVCVHLHYACVLYVICSYTHIT